ncbi:MAG: hypothetical protein Gyms2KO_33510 [Gymnodinialimonas sp.]
MQDFDPFHGDTFWSGTGCAARCHIAPEQKQLPNADIGYISLPIRGVARQMGGHADADANTERWNSKPQGTDCRAVVERAPEDGRDP